VLLAKVCYDRREVGGEVIADQHLDVLLGKLLDVGEEDLRKNFFF
jgi:hypothetical protein